MSYTYPEALTAMESIANDFMKLLRPGVYAPVYIVTDTYAKTASVTWDQYGIRITMPVRPATSVMTQDEFQDWVAYVLHEMGHPTFTDKAAWQEAIRLGVSRMVNALEDVRMERAVIGSGIVPNAKAVLSRLISRKVVEARANGWKPNARREFGWTVCVLGRAANGYAIDAGDLGWIKAQIQPGSTVETVLSWAMPALAACQSTADCVTLAERISQALAAPQAGPVDINPGQGEGEKPTSDPENAPEGPPNDNEGEGKGAGKGGKGHGDGTTDDETPVLDEKELAERGLAPEGENAKGSTAERASEKAVIDILRDSVMKSQPKDNTTANPRRMGVNATRLKDAAALAGRQRALLARALRANETDDREGGRKAGRLDRGALTRAAAGASNVFARRDIAEGYDTDVVVLLDASGSMGGENMNMALEAGLVIAQAAGSVGANCTTEVFNSTGYQRAGALASKRLPNPADYGVLVNAATGGTPLSAHMARAAVSQAKRAPAKRRVVFVVTDGACDYGPGTVKRMASYLEQTYGVVLAHVSIGTPLQGSFRAEVCVPWGTPLAKVGLDHFVKVLQAL